MATISDPDLLGSGVITGVFFSPDRTIMAVASQFNRLINPQARASYSGQSLYIRLALYARGNRIPFVAFDQLQEPINDVAFHPTEMIVAIGAGAYDGGFCFEGDLIIWNWKDVRWSCPFKSIPEVRHCRFDATGTRLEALVRPWDDDGPEEDEDTAFSTLFPVTYAYDGSLPAREAAMNAELVDGTSIRDTEATEWGFPPKNQSTAQQHADVAEWLGVADFKTRNAIRDVAWLGSDRLGVVHDDCLLETYDTATGERIDAFPSHEDYHGTEILKTTPPCIHVSRTKFNKNEWHADTELHFLSEAGLEKIGAYRGSYTFSNSADNRILGRCDRLRHPTENPADLLIDLKTRSESFRNLGQYDCFNHYIGINGAPYLFMLQGHPKTSHQQQRLCIVDRDGRAKPLWPLLPEDASAENHAMECCGCYLADDMGEAVVIAARHYNPQPYVPAAGFIYRKSLDQNRELWRHTISGTASAIVSVPNRNLIAVALLRGTLQLLDAKSGAILFEARLILNGFATVGFAMDATAEKLALGTFDGRIAIVEINDLLRHGTRQAPYELAQRKQGSWRHSHLRR